MDRFKYRWRAHPGAARSENIRLRDQLRIQQTALGGLELALQARHQTIDALQGRLEQSRAQCRRLDEECENYFRMLQAG
jgi:hypothetical protein